MVLFECLGTVSCSHSIVTLAVSAQYTNVTDRQTRPAMHRTIFTARCVVYAQHGLYCRKMSVCASVCSSVSLSVTRRYCLETAKRISKLFSPSGIRCIVVFFRAKRYGNIPTRTRTRSVEFKRYEKIAIFDQHDDDEHLALSRKRHNIRPQLLWNMNRKLYQSFRIVPFSMTFIP